MAAEKIITFETGTGAKVEIVPLSTGDTAYPARAVITATDPATKNATTLAVDVVTQTASQVIKIPAGTTLPFLDPVTGNTKIVTLGAEFTVTTAATTPFTASGSLTLLANHEAIADNSTSSNFIKLSGRTTGEISIKVNDETLFTFDSAFFKQGQAVNAEGEIKCSGAYSSIDAGLRTVQAQTAGLLSLDGSTVIATPARNMWVIVTLPAPSTAYTSGTIARAICYSTDLSLKVEAGKIITQDLPLKANGTIYIDNPLVA